MYVYVHMYRYTQMVLLHILMEYKIRRIMAICHMIFGQLEAN